MRIIVAADSQINRRIIENTTRKAGYERIRACTSAQQVFESLGTEPADVIITEKHLSDIDAIQLTTHLEAQRDVAFPAIIILADEFTSDEAVAAIKAGAQSLLIKPVLPDQLRQKLQQIT